MNNPIMNVLKKYMKSEESTMRLESPTDLIKMAQQSISPDQSNDLDREIEILEELIEEFDVQVDVAQN